MIDPFTGYPISEKELSEEDLESILGDDKFLMALKAKLGVGAMAMGGAGGAKGSDIKSGHALQNTEKTSSYTYVGYERPSDNDWYIYRRTLSNNLRGYALGTSDYATNWGNRESLTYS